ncbi:ATP-binding cassette domain-containing protein [Zhihengliuella sp. ISTPL4]|uniref:ATP-binding cassette domain-containing protein n=1 Tax=Zhihengliuella sp. ISTPL4 TaxID=2058657 RepID=UPI000C7E5EAD|nr:ATP-binding cassette domain-containing protein [Zhihengliuella sp. ISTPL4]
MTTSVLPLLEVRGIRKSFGHVKAVRGAGLSVARGEVVAVVGDNGAGKSTFVSCISGAVEPDAGEVLLEGRSLELGSILASMAAGIATVYQDLAMAPDLSVAENIFLSTELRRPGLAGRLGLIDHRRMRSEARALVDGLGITTLGDVGAPVGSLSGGQRQVVAVARAIARAGKLVILDEPTAALGARQSQMVLDTITAASGRGLGVLLISHDLPRVIEVADRIVVLRFGEVVADVSPRGLTVSNVVALMLGEQNTADLPTIASDTREDDR